jgi:hypothetical protein
MYHPDNAIGRGDGQWHRTPHHASSPNSDRHHETYFDISSQTRRRYDEPIIGSETSQLGENIQQQPAYVSNKRGRKFADMDDSPHKRPRGSHLPHTMYPSEPESDSSRTSDLYGYTEPQDNRYNIEERGSSQNVGLGLSYYEQAGQHQPSKQTVNEAHTFSPFRHSYPNDKNLHISPPLAQAVERQRLDRGKSPCYSPGYETYFQNQQMPSHTPHQNLRNQDLTESAAPNKHRRIRMSNGSDDHFPTPNSQNLRHADIMSPEVEWEHGDMRDGLIRHSILNRDSYSRNSMDPPARSPVWADANEDESIHNSFNVRAHGHIVHGQENSSRRSLTPEFETVAPHTPFGQRSGSQRVPSYQRMHMERELLEPQIEGRYYATPRKSDTPLDLSEKSTSTPIGSRVWNRNLDRQVPIHQASQRQSMAPPTLASRILRYQSQATPTPRSSQKYRPIHNSERTVMEDHERDSTPMQLLKRAWQGDSRQKNKVDYSRYNVGKLFPSNSVSYNDRPKGQVAMHRKKPPLGYGPASGIYTGSSRDTSANIPSKKSVPMKDRLAPVKKRATPKPQTDPVQDRQRRAAEIIIRKELDGLDHVIFGEVIGDSAEEKEKKAALDRAEAQRKREEREKERLIKEEMEKAAELEKKRLQKEAAENARREKEQEEERKRLKREAERKKQEEIEESIKEEKRKKAQDQIEASRQKEIAEREEREREKQKMTLIQAEAKELAEIQSRKELTKIQAASLKPATMFPSQNKKPADTLQKTVEDEDEDSLFIPETNGRSVNNLPMKQAIQN